MNVLTNPRELAVTCALEVERQHLLIPEAMAVCPYRMSAEDRNLAFEITYGTFRYLPGLAKVLAQLCKSAGLPPKIRWLLFTALYQIRFTRVPSYAVVDEANKLALSMGFKGLKPLVNGVLRNGIRKADALGQGISRAQWLLPEWLIGKLNHHYGEDTTAQWLSVWEERPNSSYWSAEDQGLPDDTRSERLPHAWHRDKPISPELFETHKLYMQNESSQAIAEMVCRLKPESVLDLCAAPGGKACYIACFGQVKRLIANDLPGPRLARLRENRDRLGLQFEITDQDALASDLEPVDLVLLDAPCSGIGIIGRHPEIKALKKEPADDALRNLQAALLAAAWRLVKPGGLLLYTVCSLDQREVPPPPADGTSHLPAEVVAGLPLTVHGHSFHVAPSARFDGFAGMLLQKPAQDPQ